jgi:hypothetical protein
MWQLLTADAANGIDAPVALAPAQLSPAGAAKHAHAGGGWPAGWHPPGPYLRCNGTRRCCCCGTPSQPCGKRQLVWWGRWGFWLPSSLPHPPTPGPTSATFAAEDCSSSSGSSRPEAPPLTLRPRSCWTGRCRCWWGLRRGPRSTSQSTLRCPPFHTLLCALGPAAAAPTCPPSPFSLCRSAAPAHQLLPLRKACTKRQCQSSQRERERGSTRAPAQLPPSVAAVTHLSAASRVQPVSPAAAAASPTRQPAGQHVWRAAPHAPSSSSSPGRRAWQHQHGRPQWGSAHRTVLTCCR